MEQIQIINGPNKEGLKEAFFARKPVNMVLAGGIDRQLIINCLEHEDRSGSSFNFKTTRRTRGYYNARNKRGHIFPPAR